jgi:L-rhamnose mutarotase
VELLRRAGIRDYSIFLDPESHTLFAVLRREAGHGMDRLPAEAVMRRWWAHMADIMATNPDGSPVTRPLRRVFHLD